MSRASQYAAMLRGGPQFGQVAPVVNTRRGAPVVRPNIRFYQERAPLLKNMDKVVGTTSAPSDQHVLTGFQGGYAVWEKKAAPAPAPAPAPSRPAPAPTPDYSAQIKELNEQAAAYRKQAEEIIAQGEAKVKELEDADLQRQKAAELQNRLAIQSAASKARGQMGAQLKIAPASQTAQTAGTAAFKRRGDRMRLAPIQTTAGINVPSGSVLNV